MCICCFGTIENVWDVIWIKKDDSRWSSWKRTWIVVLEGVEVGESWKIENFWFEYVGRMITNQSTHVKWIDECLFGLSFENHHWKGSWDDGTRCFFDKRCHFWWRKCLRHCLEVLWLLGVLMLLWWDWFSRRCVFGIIEDVFQGDFVDMSKKWRVMEVVKRKKMGRWRRFWSKDDLILSGERSEVDDSFFLWKKMRDAIKVAFSVQLRYP